MIKQCLFIIVLLFTLTQAQTDADQAESILVELKRDAENNLKDLQDNWAVNGKILEDLVVSWSVTFTNKTVECDTKQEIQEKALEDQLWNENTIRWIGETNREIITKYDKIYTDRCTANRQYIQNLKNDKIILKFLAYVKEQLDNSELSFIQKKDLTNNFMKFLSLYKTNNIKDLLELHMSLTGDGDATASKGGDSDSHVDSSAYEIDNKMSTEQRTDEQIGDEHIDIDRDEIDLDEWKGNAEREFEASIQGFKDLIDTLQKFIKQKIVINQEDEVQSGSKAADFRIKLEKEMQELDRHLYEEVSRSSVVNRRVVQSTNSVNTCKAQLADIKVTFNEAKQDYQDALANFQQKETDLNDELEIFTFVLAQYQDNVGGDEYREQLDDYTQDGEFDQSYESREIDQIDFVE